MHGLQGRLVNYAWRGPACKRKPGQVKSKNQDHSAQPSRCQARGHDIGDALKRSGSFGVVKRQHKLATGTSKASRG